MRRKNRTYPISAEVYNKMIEIGQNPNLSYKQIMEQTDVTLAQVKWASYTGKIPNRIRNYDYLKKLIEVGKDPNLSYKEIMDKIPNITYEQIRGAARKGQIPKRCFDPDKLYDFRSNGGLRSAMVRWGYDDDAV